LFYVGFGFSLLGGVGSSRPRCVHITKTPTHPQPPTHQARNTASGSAPSPASRTDPGRPRAATRAGQGPLGAWPSRLAAPGAGRGRCGRRRSVLFFDVYWGEENRRGRFLIYVCVCACLPKKDAPTHIHTSSAAPRVSQRGPLSVTRKCVSCKGTWWMASNMRRSA
jgi:hypothetical protein